MADRSAAWSARLPQTHRPVPPAAGPRCFLPHRGSALESPMPLAFAPWDERTGLRPYAGSLSPSHHLRGQSTPLPWQNPITKYRPGDFRQIDEMTDSRAGPQTLNILTLFSTE